ncbi:hypothetical protein ACH47X_19640 [Promicromonospora kroppenstedtii]|uniref:Uncharacterized protein n=1 Tax=Promicromonospora kroppenstedtii TaxID=440482 RepID=A0ABW7XNN0_9MICO
MPDDDASCDSAAGARPAPASGASSVFGTSGTPAPEPSPASERTAEAWRLDRSGARRRHPWLDQVSGGPPGMDRDLDPGGDPVRDPGASPDPVPVPGPAGRGVPQSFDADTDAWFRDGLVRVITGLTTD